jgi:hypothetical protein
MRKANEENHQFAKPSTHGRYLRIPAEDPRRFWSDSGHLLADPIGHQVSFHR